MIFAKIELFHWTLIKKSKKFSQNYPNPLNFSPKRAKLFAWYNILTAKEELKSKISIVDLLKKFSKISQDYKFLPKARKNSRRVQSLKCKKAKISIRNLGNI